MSEDKKSAAPSAPAAPQPPVQQCEAPSCGCADAYCKAWDEAPKPIDDLAKDDWTPSDYEYDRSIHHNPDAKAWAEFFVATFPALKDKEDLMHSWFANAMMAMHDYLKNQPAQDDAKDAARYRWLRDNCDRQWDIMCQDIEIIIRDTAAEDCEPLDEIIDAAMAGGGE